MTTLIVRHVDGCIARALKAQAKHHHRSAEAEHRAILEAGLGMAAPTADELAAFFRRGGELGLAEIDLSQLPRGGAVEPIRLDDTT